MSKQKHPREDLPPPDPLPPQPPAYEYDYLELHTSSSKDDLLTAMNLKGSAGWRLVWALADGGFYRIWFEREQVKERNNE
jgi:hypothetical protein